jgi:hypothetical protein
MRARGSQCAAGQFGWLQRGCDADPDPDVTATRRVDDRPDGIGPLRVGESVPSLPAAISPVTWDASRRYQAGVSRAVGTPGVGTWWPSYPDVTHEQGTDSAFSVYTVRDIETGNIESLWSFTPALKTSKGITIGSTLAQLQAAYPHFDATIPSDYVTVYTVEGSVGRTILEVATQPAEDPTFWPAAKLGTVQVIHLQLKTEQEYAISGGSDGLGICSLAPGMFGG